MSRSVRLVPLLLLVPSLCLAGEGVLEINQACVADGCFAGDPAGLPVEITAPGSYRLTSSLALPDAFSTGIFVRADNVTLDLNGFEIRGTNTCSHSNGTLSCAQVGLGYGVFTDLGVVRTAVRNGSVVGTGFTGVHLGDHSIASDLRVAWSGSGGVRVGVASVVRDCVVHQNAAGLSQGTYAGIEAVHGARIQGNSSYENGGDGIDTVDAALIESNVVHRNGDRGIASGRGSVVRSNAVYENGEHGISASGSARISGNTVTSNGFHGIVVQDIVGFGTSVSDNVVRLNGTHSSFQGVGLQLVDYVTYSGNTVTGNDSNQVVGGVNRGDNLCAGTGTVSEDCP